MVEVEFRTGSLVKPSSSDSRNISVEHTDRRGKAPGFCCFGAFLFFLFMLTEKEINGWSDIEGMSGKFHSDMFTRSPAIVMPGKVEFGGWWFRLESAALTIL